MKRSILLLAFTWLACGSEPPPPEGEEPLEDPEAPAREAALPPMPGFPLALRGHLRATSAGVHTVQGEWEARTGLCEEPATLQVLAEAPGTGTLILLMLPEDNRVTRYPIAVVRSGAPPPPAAQVGVQLFRDDGSFAFQGVEGEVEIYGYGANVSGRFAVTLREIQRREEVQYAGVFDQIPLEQLGDDYCQRLQEGMSGEPPAVR